MSKVNKSPNQNKRKETFSQVWIIKKENTTPKGLKNAQNVFIF